MTKQVSQTPSVNGSEVDGSDANSAEGVNGSLGPNHSGDQGAHSYTLVAIILHWLIALLIIGQIIGGWAMTHIIEDGSTTQFELYQLHKSFGISILLLSLGRLAWRLTHPAPPAPVDAPLWERRIAKITHILFYVLMIGVPIGGWALVSASPYAQSVPTYLFGVIPWPHLPFFSGIEDREAITGFISEMHERFAFATGALLILHIGAALKHHFINHDDVLARMLPFIKKRG